MTIAPPSADVLIIGGGPAGAMTALRLAASGRNVVLVERSPAFTAQMFLVAAP